ncbi:MAG: hypothetical protein WCW84_06865 [Sulfurimonas sp.]|jgi:hypothetical protein
MIHTAKIATKVLTPSVVSAVRPRFKRFVAYKGLYYVFQNTKGNTYPIELYIALCQELNEFDIVFVRDITKEKWLLIFNKTARPTVSIPNDLLSIHLSRYKETVSSRIIIVNDVIDVEDVDFIAIEKDPKLQFPNQRSEEFFRYFAMIVGVGILYAGIVQLQNYAQNKVVDLQMQKTALAGEVADLMVANKKYNIPLPSCDKQDSFIESVKHNSTTQMPYIINGGGKWH